MINLELPDLPYSKDELTPYMSAETLELHHDKHHMAYVTNGNKFIKEKAQIDFLVLLDENIELSDWNVQAIPTTLLINDSGKIIYKIEGEKEWDSSEFTKFFKNIIK